MTRIALFALALLATACGSGTDAVTGQYSYDMKFDFNGNKCETGKHSFSSKADYCKALQDDSLNNNCAKSMREKSFEKECASSVAEIDSASSLFSESQGVFHAYCGGAIKDHLETIFEITGESPQNGKFRSASVILYGRELNRPSSQPHEVGRATCAQISLSGSVLSCSTSTHETYSIELKTLTGTNVYADPAGSLVKTQFPKCGPTFPGR